MLIYLIKTCLLKLLQKIKNAEHKTSLYQYSTFNQITNSFLIIIDNWEQVDARVISTNWPGALISKTSVYSKYVLIHKLCDSFACFTDVSVKEIASQQQIDDVPGTSSSSLTSKLHKRFLKKKGTQKSAGKKKETKKNEIGSRSTLKWTTTHLYLWRGRKVANVFRFESTPGLVAEVTPLCIVAYLPQMTQEDHGLLQIPVSPRESLKNYSQFCARSSLFFVLVTNTKSAIRCVAGRGSVGPMEWVLRFGNISHYFTPNWLVFVSLYR